MEVLVKRIYDAPEKDDGVRVLVDRLWPRGMSKKRAAIDMWAKELAPSKELRSWFHEDKEKRLKDFERKYARELQSQTSLLRTYLPQDQHITIVTAVKEMEYSHVPTLQKFLKRR